MGVYIKGMEMPTEESIGIFLYPDGRVHVWRPNAMVGQEHKAVPVPPHGRLGDLDTLEQDAQKRLLICTDQFQRPYEVMRAIALTPTIIPAEEGQT